MVTGHGMTKAYLHRFKITHSPECVCANGDQTVDRLIFDCPKLEKEREKLRNSIYIERRRLASAEMRSSEQIPKPIQTVYKLH